MVGKAPNGHGASVIIWLCESLKKGFCGFCGGYKKGDASEDLTDLLVHKNVSQQANKSKPNRGDW